MAFFPARILFACKLWQMTYPQRKIEGLVRKWLACLPQPFTAEERAAGYDYDISILQAEFALTQVLDRPLSGRLFFEAAIRENLDLGRPEEVQLIFKHKVTRRTPGRFRTRIITEGVTPALHIDYKHSRIKQYRKKHETTINNSRDFYIGKRLKNLPLCGSSAFKPTDVSYTSRISATITCSVKRLSAGQPTPDRFRPTGGGFALHRPTRSGAVQRLGHLSLSALRASLTMNCGCCSHPLLGIAPDQLTPGQMTYHLRRLRLHGLIQRIPNSHRYQVTTSVGAPLSSSRAPMPG